MTFLSFPLRAVQPLVDASASTTRWTRLACIIAACLSGCAMPVKHPGAPMALPMAWNAADAYSATDTLPALDWWQGFGSTELSELVTTALADSPDLAVATERVIQAEISLRSVGASLFPSIDLGLNTSARDTQGGDSPGSARSSSANLAVSYEIDVWGSNLANREAASWQLLATRYDHEATRLSLIAGVVNAYTQILAQRARLAIARDNLALAERLFAIVEARYRNGIASALDVSRQRTTVLAQRDALLPMETQEAQYRRALAILLGRLPQDFDVAAQNLDALQLPRIGVVQPFELLSRRPDIAANEARLAAADANIAVARAALFPLKFSLGASINATSGNFALAGLGAPVGTGVLTLSLMQAIFDGGRLRGQVESSESQRRQQLETYRKTVLTALKEVDDAYASAARSARQEVSQQAILRETEHTLRLSELRYREGSDTLSTLLDAQRSLFSVRDQLAQLRLARLSAHVDLYKTLGGGWQADERPQAEPSTAGAALTTP